MSNQNQSTRKHSQPERSKTRVIKSHEVSGVRLAFPPSEAAATSDLPSPRLNEVQQAPKPAAGLAEAEVARTRADAMERRAAALLHEVEETAQARLTEVTAQVESMLNRAAEAAADLEHQARELARSEGYEVGYAQGLAAAQQEADELRQLGAAEAEQAVLAAQAEAAAKVADAEAKVQQLLADAEAERLQLLESNRENLLSLSMAIARQILKAELVLQPAALLPMLDAALTKLKGDSQISIRVNPEFAELLEAQRGRLLAAVPGLRQLEVQPDPALAPGDFVAQGTQGYVDGRLQRQLESVAREVAPDDT